MSSIVTSPFTVLVDTREQLPYTFSALRADAAVVGGSEHDPWLSHDAVPMLWMARLP